MAPKKHSFSRSDSDFGSDGLRCSGWLYLPKDVHQPPVLIMGHGLAARKDFRLPAFAEHFVRELGIAVFLFDYRNFGGSEGEPRNLVNPWRHGRDWDAAIGHVRSLQTVDGKRIGLWGSSFGGGHVIGAAARDRDIAVVVSQVPFVSGLSSLSMLPVRNILLGTWHGLRDGLRKLTGRRAHTIPVIGRPGTFAAMNSPESHPGYSAMIPEDSSWKNEMPARIFLTVSFYSPMSKARRVKCPVLLVGARFDSLVPIASVEKMARRLRNCRFEILESNHFEPYFGDWFEKNVKMETEFLREHL